MSAGYKLCVRPDAKLPGLEVCLPFIPPPHLIHLVERHRVRLGGEYDDLLSAASMSDDVRRDRVLEALEKVEPGTTRRITDTYPLPGRHAVQLFGVEALHGWVGEAFARNLQRDLQLDVLPPPGRLITRRQPGVASSSSRAMVYDLTINDDRVLGRVMRLKVRMAVDAVGNSVRSYSWWPVHFYLLLGRPPICAVFQSEPAEPIVGAVVEAFGLSFDSDASCSPLILSDAAIKILTEDQKWPHWAVSGTHFISPDEGTVAAFTASRIGRSVGQLNLEDEVEEWTCSKCGNKETSNPYRDQVDATNHRRSVRVTYAHDDGFNEEVPCMIWAKPAEPGKITFIHTQSIQAMMYVVRRVASTVPKGGHA